MGTDVLSPRALNRATLERQLLLRRADMPVLDTVRHLVGMQAQVPLNPYRGLWSRVERFQPDDLAQLLLDRKVVRTVVMRGTIHLVTADDALVLPRLVQPVLDAELRRHRDHAPALARVDLDALERGVSRQELGREGGVELGDFGVVTWLGVKGELSHVHVGPFRVVARWSLGPEADEFGARRVS
ncbi:MAG: DNA glycosylase AlkZ-like family protein [Actinomycetota bacterium]